MTSPTIEVAPCSFGASKYAVMNWHYSKRMPSGKLSKFGVWEDGVFIGSVIYGRGATPNLPKPYGLTQLEACELVRVALNNHKTPVSQIVAATIKQFKSSNPGMRLIISFADPKEGHNGTIYQAMNWIYAGASSPADYWMLKGELTHPRSVVAKFGTMSIDTVLKHDPTARKVRLPGKLRYLYPLDKPMRRQVAKLAQPYPNAVEGLEVSRSDSIGKVQVQSLPTALGGN